MSGSLLEQYGSQVSAARQVVTAKILAKDEDLETALSRLNAALPSDIRVFDAVRVTKGFDSKRSCDRRRYTYMLPSMLLAPDEAVRSAFARFGRDDAAIEDIRARIIEYKKHGGDMVDWRLPEDVAASLAREWAEFRAEPDVVARLRAFLAAYCGTRNFHNFTSGMPGHMEAAKRHIVEFVAAEPGVYGPEHTAEWIRLSVVGQSFMLHQIRKMVAVATQAARLAKPASLLEELCDKEVDVPLQLVPGVGLYLGEPIFESYNRFKAKDERPRIEWTSDHPKFADIEAFRTDVVEAGIVQEGAPAALTPFVNYLWMIRIFGFPLSKDEPRHPVNNTWEGWKGEASGEDDR